MSVPSPRVTTAPAEMRSADTSADVRSVDAVACSFASAPPSLGFTPSLDFSDPRDSQYVL